MKGIAVSGKKRATYFYYFLYFLFCLTLPAGTALSQHPDGWLYTQGNKIYTSDGAVFAGRGANIFDTRLNNAGAYNPPNVAEVNRRTDELIDVWGADFLRLCLESNASLDQWQVHGLSVLQDTAYLNDIVSIVEHIGTKQNVYVLVSVWVDPSLDNMGWPTTQTDSVWRILTQKLAPYPHVLFGVCNEPQNNFDGEYDAQVFERMNSAVAAIRESESNLGSPQHIITVQGTGGWARFLQYYVTHPITAGSGTNIAYEVHVYDTQSEFQNRFITPSQDLPVVIGEFGPAEGYMTLGECQTLMDTAEALQVPYLAWSFHQRAPPNLLVDPTGSGSGAGMNLIPTEWGQLLKDQLLSFGAPRIRNLTASPSSFSVEESSLINFSASVTVRAGIIDSVTIDLTSIGGSMVAMTPAGGSLYSASFLAAPGLLPGGKAITVHAVDNNGRSSAQNITVQAISPATEDLDIYTENQVLIEGTWSDQGTLTEISSGAFEGTTHYQFSFSFTNWWAGVGLNLTNWGGSGTGYNFSRYESLRVACSTTGSVHPSITLIDAKSQNPGASSDVALNGISNTYQEFTIPLSSFTGMVLDDVGEIMISMNPASASGSGTFYIDNIKLLAKNPTAVGNEPPPLPSEYILSQNYPNPFNPATVIQYQIPVRGYIALTIFDILGQNVRSFVQEIQSPGVYTVTWNGRNSTGQTVASGIYFYQLKSTSGFIQTKKMLFLK